MWFARCAPFTPNAPRQIAKEPLGCVIRNFCDQTCGLGVYRAVCIPLPHPKRRRRDRSQSDTADRRNRAVDLEDPPWLRRYGSEFAGLQHLITPGTGELRRRVHHGRHGPRSSRKTTVTLTPSHTVAVTSMRVDGGSCHCCSRVSSHWSKVHGAAGAVCPIVFLHDLLKR